MGTEPSRLLPMNVFQLRSLAAWPNGVGFAAFAAMTGC